MHYCCVIKPNDKKIPKDTKVEKKFRSINQNDTKYINPMCPICLSNYSFGSTVTILECGHIYHKECLDLWHTKKKTCPLCQR